MKIMPILSFYMKHGSQIEAMFSKGSSPEGGHLVLDIALAAAPIIKKYWPQLNENDLVDDALALLKDQLLPSPAAPAPDNALVKDAN